MEKYLHIGAYCLFTGVIIGLLVNSCEKNNGGTNTIEVHKNTIKIYDSTKKEIKSPAPAALVDTRTVSVPADVDTAAILLKFHSVFTYSQQFSDSIIRAIAINTVSQNKIIGSKFSYQLLQPVKTIESTTLTVTNNSYGLFAGAFSGVNQVGFGPQISYLTKKQISFGGGYDLINKFGFVNIQFKINGRSNRQK